MKNDRPTPTVQLVLHALAEAGERGLLAREIAASVGGITAGTATNYARRLQSDGLVGSLLEAHPGYPHIIRRRYWAIPPGPPLPPP
jgi:hypothetical protein